MWPADCHRSSELAWTLFLATEKISFSILQVDELVFPRKLISF